MAQQNTMSYWVKDHFISKVTGKDAIDYIDFWRHPQKTYKPILKMHIEYVAKNVNNYIVQDELTQTKWLEIWRDDGVHDENKELLYKCTTRELLDMAQDYAHSKGWDDYDDDFEKARGKLRESRKGIKTMKRLNTNDIDSIDLDSPIMKTWFALSSDSFIKNLERALKDVAEVIGEESSEEFFETIIVESNDIGLRFFYNFDLEDETIEVMTHGTASSRYEKNIIDVVPFSKINFTEKGIIDFINKETRDTIKGRYNESRKGVKTMKKLTERTEDYEDLLEQYGKEYLSESNPDYDFYEMDMLNDFYSNEEPIEILERAFNGYAYGHEKEPFNPNHDYFAFNGYGNLISFDDYWVTDYLKDNIDESYFMEWLADNGYIDEEDDD